jgi:tetratricopeptide (TPR) repeat protein
MPHGGRVASTLLVLLVLLSAAGCASVTPEGQAQRDRVLTLVQRASAAMRNGDYATARADLDAALLRIGASTAGDDTAREARGLFNEESVKTFRGEPYERVMAYYYRGILYWMDGEPDNARAAFRSAAVQDQNPELGITQSDWVLIDYLDGLASLKLGGDGADAFRRAEASSKLNKPPAYDPQANVLVFLEMGQGPSKYAAGEYGEQLRFRPGHAADPIALVKVGGQQIRVGPYDDLTYQATTRGGRVMDHVLKGKAVFKGTTDALGTGAILAGAGVAIAGDSNAARNAGLGLVAAGVISKIISAATTPAADTRQWNNLPQLLSFAALRLPPGSHTLDVEFQNTGGKTLITRQVQFQVVPGRDAVLFVSDRNN